MPSEINRDTAYISSPIDNKELSLDEVPAASYKGRKVTVTPKDVNVNYMKIDVDNKATERIRVKEHKYKQISMYHVVQDVATSILSWLKNMTYRPKETHVLKCLNENVQTMAKRFNGEGSEKLFQFDGCCYGIASFKANL